LVEFVIVWQNTPCECLSSCYGLLTGLALLNSVDRWRNTTQFLQNGVIWYACVHGPRKDFIQGGTSGFFQPFFQGGAKMVKFVFYQSKLRKQHFLLKFSNCCPPSNTHACV